jgi:hypothetical protein
LRKLKILVVTLAMTLLFAAPAFAQDGGVTVSAALLDTDVGVSGVTITAHLLDTDVTVGGDADFD